MKKALVTAIIFLYLIVSFGSIFRLGVSYNYVSIDSYNYVMFHHWIILLVLAILQVGACVFLAKRALLDIKPKKNINPIYFKIFGIPLAITLFFLFNSGFVLFLDYCFKDAEILNIKGVVLNKKIEYRSGKGPKRLYYLSISDTVTTQNYYFEVEKFIYDRYNINDVFVKDFNVSKFGMIYRKEQ